MSTGTLADQTLLTNTWPFQRENANTFQQLHFDEANREKTSRAFSYFPLDRKITLYSIRFYLSCFSNYCYCHVPKCHMMALYHNNEMHSSTYCIPHIEFSDSCCQSPYYYQSIQNIGAYSE